MTELRDNSKRAKLAINIFWLICIVNIIAVISGYFEFELLERVVAGEILDEQEAISNDLRQAFIAFFQFGLIITSIVLFLNWFRRSYGNLKRVGKALEQNENMSVWSFFIPIVSLFRPYLIAKEIAVKTEQSLIELNPEYKSSINKVVIGLWWTLFLISNYVGQFAFKSILKDETIDQLITSTKAYMISDFVDIIAAVITIIMITNISKDEASLFESIKNTSANSGSEKMRGALVS